MTGYDVAAALVFAALSLASWAVVAVVAAMPTTDPICPPGCHCRGRLSALDHADGQRITTTNTNTP